MSSRGFNSTAIAESIKPFNSISTLVEILIDPNDPAYITDFGRDIAHDGKTFTSLQGLLGISTILENNNNGIENVTITLTAVPDTYVKMLLDYSYIGRSIKLHKVFLDEAGAITGNSVLVFDGVIDKPMIKHDVENETASIGLTASSHWTNFNRTTGRYTNDASQQTYFSGDECFQYAIDYEKEITWGQA